MSDTTINQQNQTIHGTQINAARDVNYVINQAPPTPITFPHYYISPQRNARFVGRQRELDQLHHTLRQGGTIPITQSVAGLGGVGKTQLAAEYAYRHLEEYDLIYWLPAGSEQLLVEAMAALAYRLNVARRMDNQPAAAARAAVAWLASRRDRRWLLIYDNADLPDMPPDTLAPYLPTTGNGAIVITSRNDEWGDLHPLRLGVFTAAETMAFWDKKLKPESGLLPKESLPDDQKERLFTLLELAGEMGYLALALEHAAAYMNTHHKTAAAYLRLYRQQRKALWGKHIKPPKDYQQRTIMTTWGISFAALDAEAAALLNFCAFLAPDNIPVSLLAAHAAELPPPLDGCAADELRLDGAIAALHRHALMTRQEEMLSVHRLVQVVARERMGEDTAVWVDAIMNVLGKAYNFDQHDTRTWTVCGRLLPHVMMAVELATVLDIKSTEIGRLNNDIGVYLRYYGDLVGAKPFYQESLAIYERVLGGDHPDTARSLNNMGELLLAMRNYDEVQPFLSRALAIFEEQPDPDPLDIATTLNNIGLLRKVMGEYLEARLYYERSLAIRKRHFGSEHISVAASYNNLCRLLHTMGLYPEAQLYCERALAIREKQLDPNHFDVATSLNNLGGVLKAMGRYEEARLYYKRSLVIREERLDPNYRDVVQSLNNLGELLREMKEYGEARLLYDRALAIGKERFSSDDAGVATSLNNLGVLLQEIGKYKEARSFYNQTRLILEKQLGDDHPSIATLNNNLAWLAYDEGDAPTAVRLMRRALEVFEGALGSEHPTTYQVRGDLAAIEAAL